MSKTKEAERKIDACVDAVRNHISTKKVESAKVENIIESLHLSGKDKGHLSRRKDKRSHFEFFFYIKMHDAKEQRQVRIIENTFIKYCEPISFKEFGNKDKGRARIQNYNSKPDKKVIIGNKTYIMDLKELKEHCFKISDLKSYSEIGSGIFVITNRFVYIYGSEWVKKFYKVISQPIFKKHIYIHPEWDKLVVKIGDDDRSFISLKELVDKKAITRLER